MSNGDFPDPGGSPFTTPSPGGGISIGDLVNWIIGLLAAIWAALVAAIEFVWNTLVDFIKAVVGVFKKIGKIFQTVFSTIFRKGLLPLIHLYQQLHDWLVKVLGPVIKILRRMRAIYDDWFKRYVQPVLKIINHVRAVLAVFKQFHIKWAMQLDSDLAKIENTIIKDFEKLRQELNKTLSWVQLIEDPAGLLLRGPLAASIKRALNDILKATTGNDLNFYTGSFQAGSGGGSGPYGPKDGYNDARDAGIGADNILTESRSVAIDFIGELRA